MADTAEDLQDDAKPLSSMNKTLDKEQTALVNRITAELQSDAAKKGVSKSLEMYGAALSKFYSKVPDFNAISKDLAKQKAQKDFDKKKKEAAGKYDASKQMFSDVEKSAEVVAKEYKRAAEETAKDFELADTLAKQYAQLTAEIVKLNLRIQKFNKDTKGDVKTLESPKFEDVAKVRANLEVKVGALKDEQKEFDAAVDKKVRPEEKRIKKESEALEYLKFSGKK
jgi:hypothetical protein